MEDEKNDSNSVAGEGSCYGSPIVNGFQLEAQSRELYSNFLREELQSEGFQIPGDIPQLLSNGFSNPIWLCNASNLRQLANEFSHSPLREHVRIKAQSVNLATLNAQNFSEMILEVFRGGSLTQERVLVVFFFCSDIALFALQNRAIHLFGQLISWSTDFITGRFSQFIRDQGGWGAVLNNSVNTMLKISATAACIVAIIAMVVFIRKNI